MINFLKRHYILTAFLALPFGIYIYLYFTDFRYDDDLHDFRHYPIPPLTEKWSKTIEYKTLPKVKFRKCFIISFNESQLRANVNKMFGEGYISIITDEQDSQRYYSEAYTRKYGLYHTEDLTEEEFYAEAKTKPHFWLKIYQDNVLLENRELYFTNFNSSSDIKIGDRELYAPGIIGRPGYKDGYCHDFSENTNYRLEIINDQIIPEFHDVEVFFTLRPVQPKV